MLYLLLVLAVTALVYLAVRTTRPPAQRPKTRVIGPDDDPEFLSRLRHGDNDDPR